jgi:flagellar hook protein FlgE
MNISNNISSISSHQTMMNASANNVANVNTDGFVPKSTVINSSDENTPKANVRTSDSNGSTRSQTDISKEIPDQMLAQDAVAVNVSAIKTKDEMLGSLLDIRA